MIQPDTAWWRRATIYQIYPKSFQDSGAKGQGDLRGILRRLDYLQLLGVDAIWLTPIYHSPQVDNGYDVADYYRIDPLYGTMADFQELAQACKDRGIHIIMDMVFNHTSTEHSWFQNALHEPHSRYRNFYIWRDPVNGHEPNNWISKFGGSAWQKDDASGQYYLHLFSPQQADLNWDNPDVRAEIKHVIHFWQQQGVDGFRLDVINLISKDPALPDDPNGDGRPFYTDGPFAHDYLHELSQDIFLPGSSMTVGEMSSTSVAECQRYSAPDSQELSMVFQFHHLKIDYPDGQKWHLMPPDFIALKQCMATWQTGLYQQGWNALFWCNHDQPRIVSRFGNDGAWRVASATCFATLLHCLQGTPYIYQGEEIGMTNPHFTKLAQYRDIESLNAYQEGLAAGRTADEMLATLAARSRDNSRTPMQWDATEYAGFSTTTPWIDLADNADTIHVTAALNDPDSIFYYYQKLIQLRKIYAVITEGNYHDILPDHPDLWCYERTYSHEQHTEQLLVIGNMRDQPIDWVVPETWRIRTQTNCILHNTRHTPELKNQCLLPYSVMVWYHQSS